MVKQAIHKKEDWPKLIKAYRKSLGENQEVFGKRFGVSYVAVHYWETGRYDPPAEVIHYFYVEGVFTP